jgi:lipopolysaccharide export LptBFGC system permease protein LptF
MPKHTTRQLLRRHAVAFGVSFVAFTTALLALYASRRLPELSARGVPTATLIDAVLLGIPFTAAMTIPMAAFVAVLSVFMELGGAGVLAAARRTRGGVRRLVTPVLWAAVGMAALTLVLNTQIVPRANERLAVVLAVGTAERNDISIQRNDRVMMVGELRAAARDARRVGGPHALATAAALEVEVQKKFALAAACVIMALAAAAIALRFPHGGTLLVIGASLAIFGVYYFGLSAGETLADELVVSPFIAMWGANALVLAAALLGVWPSRRPLAPTEAGPLAVGG